MYRFWITKIFQTRILFETNKFHQGGGLAAGGPGQLPPLPPLIRPCLQHRAPATLPKVFNEEHVCMLSRGSKAFGLLQRFLKNFL